MWIPDLSCSTDKASPLLQAVYSSHVRTRRFQSGLTFGVQLQHAERNQDLGQGRDPDVLLMAHEHDGYTDLWHTDVDKPKLNCGIWTQLELDSVVLLCVKSVVSCFGLEGTGRFAVCDLGNLSLSWDTKKLPISAIMWPHWLCWNCTHDEALHLGEFCFLTLDCWTCEKVKALPAWEPAELLTHLVTFRLNHWYDLILHVTFGVCMLARKLKSGKRNATSEESYFSCCQLFWGVKEPSYPSYYQQKA